MQSSGTRNSSDGRVIRRRVGLSVVLGLLLAEALAMTLLGGEWGTGMAGESGKVALGGLGALLVSVGSVLVAGGR
jgi:hypothetical protein